MRVKASHGKRALRIGAVLVLSALLGGCAGNGSANDEDLTAVPGENNDGRLAVIITCDTNLANFSAAVEERYPDVRLIQECYTGEFKINEHLARVEHEDLGDLVMVKAGQVPKADLSEQLIDLSTTPFPGGYNANALQADEDGHIYLIPGPLSFNCNIYNKTLFEEKGWTVPKTCDEFMALCKNIDKTGIRGYRFIYHDSSLQSFQIYNYCVRSALDTLTQVEGQTWHNRLLQGMDVSLEPMKTAFEDMRLLMDAGIVRLEDMDFTSNMRYEALVGRQAAMSSGEIALLQKLNQNGGDTFSFLPHFSMTDGQGWLLNLGYYFGANVRLTRSGNEEKRRAAMEILSFIATEEGQRLLMEDGVGMVPATRGAQLGDAYYLENIRTQIENGHYIMRPGYDMFTPVLETEIAAFMKGETTADEIVEKCGRLLAEGAPEEKGIGEAAENFTVLQTGILKADALRSAAGTDIALAGMAEADCYVPVGGTRSKLYKGIVTDADVTRIAQIETDVPLMCTTASVTGRELLAVLEYGATSLSEQEAGKVGHYHPFAVSGLSLSYSPGAEEGFRVGNIRLNDGTALKPDGIYTVAFLKGALTAEGLTQIRETDISMTDALRDYIISGNIVAPDTRRIAIR